MRVFALVLLAWSWVPSAALAQDGDVEAARRAYEMGAAAAAEERWDEAHRAFARSYELFEAPSAGFNAAMALRAQGRHVEARDSLAALIERHREWEHLGMVRERLEEERARVAFLRIGAIDPPDAELRLDGRRIPLPDDRAFALDAGEHVLRAEAPAHEPFERSVSLSDGETIALDVRLTEVAGDDIAASPWLWIVVGVVVVGGGVLTGVLVDDAMQLRPESENVVRFP